MKGRAGLMSSEDKARLDSLTSDAFDHTHTEYALANHNHDTSYATINHNHKGVYADIGHNHDTAYATLNHNHNSSYAAIGHNHDSTYAAKSHSHTEYASSTHNHDTSYAAKSHSHTEYASSTHNHDTTYAKLSGAAFTGGVSGTTASFSGTVTLSKTTDLSGTANNSPALIVGGAATAAHLEFDSNEIQAKTNGTSVAELHVNWDGGAVHIGEGGLSAKGGIVAPGFAGLLCGMYTTSTSGSTAAKVAKNDANNPQTFSSINLSCFFLWVGNNNTAANPTLNINSTGAKPIYHYTVGATLEVIPTTALKKGWYIMCVTEDKYVVHWGPPAYYKAILGI